MKQEEQEMWSDLFLLAEVASLEYDRLHSTVIVTETEAAIEGHVEGETTQNRALLIDPFVLVTRRSRTYVPRRPSSTENPQNPRHRSSPPSSSSSLSDSKRRMKRPMVASEEENETSQVKKRKKYNSGASSSSSMAPRETPLWLLNLMREMNGEEPKLIIEKNLFQTDVSRNHGRLSIPWNHIVEKDFLTAMEETMIDNKCRFKTSDVDLTAVLVDPRLLVWNVVLRRWDMKKSSGNYTSTYVLLSAWNCIVDTNRYREGDAIELWSFRSEGRLCFALVPPRRSSCNSGKSSSAL